MAVQKKTTKSAPRAREKTRAAKPPEEERPRVEEQPRIKEHETEWGPTDLEIVRQVGAFGRRLHNLFSRLPGSLHIARQDAVEMHRRIDENTRLRSISYWMFIVASCGIATLGLIINSPAVIIGAMLVSPLMSPIIGLGMGLAIKDVYLGMKSVLNLALSFFIAVMTSALITIIVPLNEPTAEIMGRVHPTFLDLFVALFCGLVASLSSVLSGGRSMMKDVAPDAAIGVALMPPICVVGFALGAGFHLNMMWGAFLLFITNLMAIVLVSSLFYYFVYDRYNLRRLIQLLSARRKKEETFYSSRLRLLWTEADETFLSRNRFWFPALLVLIISYPLLSSLMFLKQKNDVRLYLQNNLKRIKGMQLIRGPEALVYTSDGVRGVSWYSSLKMPDPNFADRLRDEIAQRFSGYRADISLVRMAGAADLSALKKTEELSLDTSRNTLYDRVRNENAARLVQRALELLLPRFPREAGIITDVRLSYSTTGPDAVFIQYVGKRMARETSALVEATLRNELRSLKGDVQRVVLHNTGPEAGVLNCAPGARGSRDRMRERIAELTAPLRHNPYLKLKLALSSDIAPLMQEEIGQSKGVKIEIEKGRRCYARWEYLP